MKKIPKSFLHAHDKESIIKRLREERSHSYLKDFVYGSIDGTISTFAVVSGVVGAQLSHKVILVLGVANLLADGFSMAASNYMGTKTENQEIELIEQFENHQIDTFPEGEKREVKHILEKKGYSGNLLNQNLKFIISNRKRWLNLMMTEEYGVSGSSRSALRAAFITFLAFVAFGTIPLASYLIELKNPFIWASSLTGVSFIIIGSLKSKWTIEGPVQSALKTLAIGTVASLIAYLVGVVLKNTVIA